MQNMSMSWFIVRSLNASGILLRFLIMIACQKSRRFSLEWSRLVARSGVGFAGVAGSFEQPVRIAHWVSIALTRDFRECRWISPPRADSTCPMSASKEQPLSTRTDCDFPSTTTWTQHSGGGCGTLPVSTFSALQKVWSAGCYCSFSSRALTVGASEHPVLLVDLRLSDSVDRVWISFDTDWKQLLLTALSFLRSWQPPQTASNWLRKLRLSSIADNNGQYLNCHSVYGSSRSRQVGLVLPLEMRQFGLLVPQHARQKLLLFSQVLMPLNLPPTSLVQHLPFSCHAHCQPLFLSRLFADLLAVVPHACAVLAQSTLTNYLRLCTSFSRGANALCSSACSSRSVYNLHYTERSSQSSNLFLATSLATLCSARSHSDLNCSLFCETEFHSTYASWTAFGQGPPRVAAPARSEQPPSPKTRKKGSSYINQNIYIYILLLERRMSESSQGDEQNQARGAPQEEGTSFRRQGSWLDTQGRKWRCQGLPRNTSAYIAAIDLIAGGLWLKRLTLQEEEEQEITDVLRRKTEASRCKGSIKKAMTRIMDIAKEYGEALREEEDPFLIIQVLRRWLGGGWRGGQLLEPICKCECGCTDDPRKTGDLTYRWSKESLELIPKQSLCGHCGQGMVPRVEFLPEEFHVKLQNLPSQFMIELQLPYFKDYRVTGYVQFNRETNRFRTLKVQGKQGYLLDGESVIHLDGYNKIESTLQDNGWATYVLCYQRKVSARDGKYYNDLVAKGADASQLMRFKWERTLIGGTDNEVVLGNVCQLSNSPSRTENTTFIGAMEPTMTIVQEASITGLEVQGEIMFEAVTVTTESERVETSCAMKSQSSLSSRPHMKSATRLTPLRGRTNPGVDIQLQEQSVMTTMGILGALHRTARWKEKDYVEESKDRTKPFCCLLCTYTREMVSIWSAEERMKALENAGHCLTCRAGLRADSETLHEILVPRISAEVIEQLQDNQNQEDITNGDGLMKIEELAQEKKKENQEKEREREEREREEMSMKGVEDASEK